MKQYTRILVIYSVLICVFLTHCSYAQEKTGKIVVGEYEKIYSHVLQEERKISVSLPEGYSKSSLSYPLLFVLDGDWEPLIVNSVSTVKYINDFGQVPQMIVVGIGNTIRNRDMIPAVVPERRNSGGSDNFLTFIVDELIPYLDENYRTEPFHILYGGSNAGLFTVYAMLKRPDIFFAGIAGSPMIGHCREFMFDTADNAVKTKDLSGNILYMIYGENDYSRVLNDAPGFYEMLKSKSPEGFSCELVKLDGEGHVPFVSLHEGLRYIYADWPLTASGSNNLSLDDVFSHYRTLSKKYGYQVAVPLNILLSTGYDALQENKLDTAKNALEKACEIHPYSPDAHYYLGEVYEKENDIETALTCFGRALEANPDYTMAKQKIESLKKKEQRDL